MERPGATALRAAPALWFTVAFNLLGLFGAILLLTLLDNAYWAVWLPVASLPLSAAVGLACLARRQTRRFGAGCLGGTVVSIAAFLVLFVIFFVTYFIVPGGHELS